MVLAYFYIIKLILIRNSILYINIIIFKTFCKKYNIFNLVNYLFYA